MKTYVIASGYFDPLHVGHIEYLEKAKELGDHLIVILNNPQQSRLKYGLTYLSMEDREKHLNALRCVDGVLASIDQDASVSESLYLIAEKFKSKGHDVIFAKGGDRTVDEIPEKKICDLLGIKIVDGLGQKIRSSSQMRKEIRPEEIIHPWGVSLVLYRHPCCAVKSLIIKPGESTSLQYHEQRHEMWICHKGTGLVETEKSSNRIQAMDVIFVPCRSQHRLTNVGQEPLHITEFQAGPVCEESDIVRIEDKYGRVK